MGQYIRACIELNPWILMCWVSRQLNNLALTLLRPYPQFTESLTGYTLPYFLPPPARIAR